MLAKSVAKINTAEAEYIKEKLEAQENESSKSKYKKRKTLNKKVKHQRLEIKTEYTEVKSELTEELEDFDVNIECSVNKSHCQTENVIFKLEPTKMKTEPLTMKKDPLTMQKDPLTMKKEPLMNDKDYGETKDTCNMDNFDNTNEDNGGFIFGGVKDIYHRAQLSSTQEDVLQFDNLSSMSSNLTICPPIVLQFGNLLIN